MKEPLVRFVDGGFDILFPLDGYESEEERQAFIKRAKENIVKWNEEHKAKIRAEFIESKGYTQAKNNKQE
jgi:hypothetical protein